LPSIGFMFDSLVQDTVWCGEEKTIKPLELAKRSRGILEEKKGIDIRLWDVRRVSEITDFMLVTSGTSPPHLKAMCEEVVQQLKAAGVTCYRRAGTPDSGWMVLDYVDVIIHIFSPTARRYYEIEELWAEARELK